MRVSVRTQPGAPVRLIEVEQNTGIDELLSIYRDELPYDVYAARLNNHVVRLDTKIHSPSEVTFLDLRDPSGNQAFQNSLVELYLAAAKEVFPKASAIIAHSLNRGIFTRFTGMRAPGATGVARIQKVMDRMVAEDISFDDINSDNQLLVPSTGYMGLYDLTVCRGGLVIRIPDASDPGKLPPYRDDKKLHKAFRDQEKWNAKLGIRYVDDLNEKIRKQEIDEIIRICEALHEKSIAGIADQIVRSQKRIVLIAGPSSSGKTTFAHRLCTQLWVAGDKPIYLGTDDYYLDRSQVPAGEDGRQNFENLDALDLDLFNDNMNRLLAGEEVDIPRFDFVAGKKVFGTRFMQAAAHQPIVIEGIHGLNDAMSYYVSDEEKFKIYISPLTQLRIDNHTRIPLTDVRKLRRIVRDAAKRGWDARKTIEAWPMVRAGEDVNIFPYSDAADAIFNSVHVYEMAVLKMHAQPLLESIGEEEEAFSEARRLLRLLSYVEALEDDSVIVNNSIIREFIGGSAID